MLISFCQLLLLTQVFSKDTATLDERLENISRNIASLKYLAEESFITHLYKELNSLQETMNNINAEISNLDTMAGNQLEHHAPLNIKEAEITIKTTDRIIEKLALMDTKLINIDDREILDKIEEYVLKMDEFDNYLRKGGRDFKEKIQKFTNHIKDKHSHIYLIMLSIFIGLILMLSIYFLAKTT
ncbi:hypothetical protein SteCoe_5631 [Stentor coeruleus]|uniref:t-SNARE coiled-coil homology domain-containing protein n=1 Tax=Stentor coeruleus TaxID=5963 RepID=A0A1R2CRY9_9CILI|nr:hypothetical protein SteCoe_5631 [Stentor coeruleus]